MKKIATFTGMKITRADVKVQEERSRFHAKYPAMVFDEKPRVSSAIDPAMERLMKLYTQIENLRQEVTTLQL